MTAATLFVVAGTAIAGLCLVLSLAIVARRGLRERTQRRERALAEPYRALLVALVVDEDVDQEHLATLLALDNATWEALEPIVVSMVRKLRGEAREVLVEPSRCPRCGSSQRTKYENPKRIDFPGSGLDCVAIVYRTCRCMDCGQARRDQEKVYAPIEPPLAELAMVDAPHLSYSALERDRNS